MNNMVQSFLDRSPICYPIGDNDDKCSSQSH